MGESEEGLSKKEKAPVVWGKRTAEFFSGLEEREVVVAVTTGQVFKGVLIGVDVYDLLLRQSSGLEMLVHKGALVYVHAAPAQGAAGKET